eukprot:SM000075S21942  [mRNA]  locus=s75:91957:98287:- [translate_table: standard]
MADGTALVPPSVLRNLPDKVYEKRKNAALELEGVVKALCAAGDNEKLEKLLNMLINDFALSPQSNHRKKIVPAVLHAFTDQDSRVRYYACEAIYNIAKVSRGEIIIFFNELFDSLCKLSADSDPNVQNAAHLLDRLIKDIVTESDQFSIEEFIPLLRERLSVLNPCVRQFLVGWITVLDSVPDIDMLGFLPDFLDGLFNMLSDSAHEIRQHADNALTEFLHEIKNATAVEYGRIAAILVQRAASLDEFTRLTALTWLNEFVKLGKDQLVPYYDAILGAILPCISDKEEKIRAVAKETAEELKKLNIEAVAGFDVRAVCCCQKVVSQLTVLAHKDELVPALLQALSDPSDEVALLVLEVQASIAQDAEHFKSLMLSLMHRFKIDRALLEKRGSLAIRQLCVLLEAEKVYRECASILELEKDLEFATIMVQALNLILFTAPEMTDLRLVLKQSLRTPEGQDLFNALYASWCHSPIATVNLCLLAQAYELSSTVISNMGEADIDINLLVQVDKLVHLLELPVFAYLRLQVPSFYQLLEPGLVPMLLKTLYGLLMLLPQQSSAFKILRTRLKSVPPQAVLQRAAFAEQGPSQQVDQSTKDGLCKGVRASEKLGYWTKLQQLQEVQKLHKEHKRHTKQQIKIRSYQPVLPTRRKVVQAVPLLRLSRQHGGCLGPGEDIIASTLQLVGCSRNRRQINWAITWVYTCVMG